jgi:hypothetical protein
MKWGIVGEDSEYIPKLGGYLASTPIPKTSHTGCFLSRGNLPRTTIFSNIIFEIRGILGVDRACLGVYPIPGGREGGACTVQRPITPSNIFENLGFSGLTGSRGYGILQ